MAYEWMDALLMQLPGVERDFKVEWNMVRFRVGGKMFAAQGHYKTGEDIISLKADPEWAEILRGQYAEVIPGYYMDKVHWVSIFRTGAVPDDIVKDLLLRAYQLVFAALTKRLQAEIQAAALNV